MKKISLIIAISMMISALPGFHSLAAIGDVYPAANMTYDSNNQIFADITKQISGAGTVTQTSSVWRYQYAPVDDFSENAYTDFTYKNANGHLLVDSSTSYPRQITGWNCQPGWKYDIAMTFIAPEDGWVEISNANTNHLIRTGYIDNGYQDGTLVKILKGGEQLWPQSGWAKSMPTVEQEIVYQEVKTGDKIHFRVNKNTNIDNDGVQWNPTVRYVDLIYFEKDKYYASYVKDNDGGNYDDCNITEIPAVVSGGEDGDIVYVSNNPEIITPVGDGAKFKLLSSGTATISASLVIGGKTVKTVTTTVEVLLNNVGGPYEYIWNGAINQGPVWYYKALVPAGAEESVNYVDMTTVSKNETWNFFTFSHTNDYGYIRSDNRMHPGNSGSPTFAFKAPKNGLIKIGAKTGLYPQFIGANSRDGIRYRIAHNDKVIYPNDGSAYKTIPIENVGVGDDYGEIYTTVQKGDFIYFTLDKNENTYDDMSAWSPTVTYMPNTFKPNPLGLDDRMSVAPRMPVTDGGVQNDDTLQIARELGMADIEVSGNNSGSASGVADAVNINNTGTELKFNSEGSIDIVFNDSYNGGRVVENLDLMLHSTNGESGQFSIDLYYSKTSDKDTLIPLYSAAQILEQKFNTAYPFIRLDGFEGKVSDVYKIHIVINGTLQKKTCIAEIDINMSGESNDIISKRAEINKPVKIPEVFSDNMMIQRDKPIKLWGYGGSEEVTVELISDGNVVRKKTVTTKDGKWEAVIDSLAGGHSVYTLKVTDTKDANNFDTTENILIGDIWLASGQSNMAYEMSGIDTWKKDLEEAVYDEIRYFQPVTNLGSMYPWEDSYGGKWKEAVGSNISGMSAIGYHFAKEIYEQNDKNIPIGIISASKPGTTINSWLSEEFFNTNDEFASSNYLHTSNPYSDLSDYTRYELRSCACYNALVHPFTSTNIKGVIWYQGEDDGYRPEYYKKILPKLMESRRNEFDDSNMPFYLVQLPSYGTPLYNARWPEMREAQLQVALTDINSGIAITTDVGEYSDVHPTNKKPVGQRLGYAVAANVYGKNIEYSGPLYDHVSIDGKKVIVHFTHVADGLVTQTRNPDYNPVTDDKDTEFIKTQDGIVNGFEISADGVNFVPATAKISGNTVEVTGVENPVSIRFGWAHYCLPELNLFNSENMPAAPFRVMNFESESPRPEISLTGDKVTVSGKIVNKNRMLINPSILLVTYDSNGFLKNIQIKDLKVALGEETEYSYKTKFSPEERIKAFVWGDINSLIPLTDFTEF